ncbi:tautomerase family protein [Enterococcus rivorum]|uniref:4-oxalocrotonate tautomerase n=1 Tax=Enterococcus rivorum TaxID=762845 RepID=A0A1E5KT08_9ENTE|nr:hypothetical protein [Enterococcus rivorum]MBP2098072.1 phenylpyruvate tautomerase PptA (4-oxalocrotonate tautomerase family) [Enterococcus rivorum]OEH81017.1 hypothetical protein BCR26_05750 [Enterococcus rivorum]
MPFYSVKTSIPLDENTKKSIVINLTKITTNLLTIVAPDKIQVILQTLDRNNLARGGVVLSDQYFSTKSRFYNSNYNESYFEGTNMHENLLTVELDLWEGFSDKQKGLLGEKISSYFKEIFCISGDNCLILIRDMKPVNWIQNGIAGDHLEFLNESRKF